MLSEIDQKFVDLEVYLDFWITRRSWELRFDCVDANNPIISFEKFCTEISRQTNKTWLYEWRWKWPNGSINIKQI